MTESVEPYTSKTEDKIVYACPSCHFVIKRKTSEPRPQKCPGRDCQAPFQYEEPQVKLQPAKRKSRKVKKHA